jgi:purine-binding chemotaxis protein CheW
MNLRGAAVPVVDLGARLGRAAAPVGKKTCFVIVDACRGGVSAEVGLLVESVSAVIDIAPGDIEPPPDIGSSRDAGLIRGIGKLGQRFVVILDPDRICAAGEPPAPASTPRWTPATACAPQPA